MPDPLSIQGVGAGQLSPVSQPGAAGVSGTAGGKSFNEILLNSLDEVNRLQQEAAQGVEKVATGETANLAEVFTAVRKADVAFSMLMEMRNKLVEAYQEIQQMRV
ncbi:MAG: flagellar hook-basal body complex protein FliE [Phycisphaerae bacterium]|nr:flagellar hook-basal body complex protein FliE [Phycisphaerae bacterium]